MGVAKLCFLMKLACTCIGFLQMFFCLYECPNGLNVRLFLRSVYTKLFLSCMYSFYCHQNSRQNGSIVCKNTVDFCWSCISVSVSIRVFNGTRSFFSVLLIGM